MGAQHTTVEGGEDPWLDGVKVDALDSLAASKELALQIDWSQLNHGRVSNGHGRFAVTRQGKPAVWLGQSLPGCPGGQRVLLLTFTSNFIVASRVSGSQWRLGETEGEGR